jgi:DNA-binding LacI/PurR family transcriptional regulator
MGVDGVLAIAPKVAATSAVWDLPPGFPVVAVEAGTLDEIPVVAVDQHEGARLATEHLLGLGHATVHHLAGPAEWQEAELRLEGWRGALDAAGARGRSPLRGDWSPRSGYELGQRMAELPDLTAVFVANDQMALGLIRALHEHGRRVPEDVSIVGFDDIPEAEYFLPPLTTVRQDFNEMGRLALHCLLDGIGAQRRSTAPAIVAATLIVRARLRPSRLGSRSWRNR